MLKGCVVIPSRTRLDATKHHRASAVAARVPVHLAERRLRNAAVASDPRDLSPTPVHRLNGRVYTSFTMLQVVLGLPRSNVIRVRFSERAHSRSSAGGIFPVPFRLGGHATHLARLPVPARPF